MNYYGIELRTGKQYGMMTFRAAVLLATTYLAKGIVCNVVLRERARK